jgi:hypothetical protein
VVAGLKEPQGELPQVTDQVTPALLLSLLTTAVRLVVAPFVSDAGGLGLSATEIAGGGRVMVTVAEADLVVSVTEVAVIVTVFAEGTVAGAV